MNNQNITIGIDLGTTNSSIAINVDGKIEVIKKPGGMEYTPSVFGFDKSDNKVVGQKAYDYLYKHDDSKNFKAEIKREMGTSEKTIFERVKVKLTPEEISAEILKSLKEDILRKYPDFETVAAVICVPAAFSVLQSEATKKAGNLAGFKHVVLLQEPIAAAISYGFMNSKNENWLIYDLGGGTFDVALISCKDGVLSVLGHNGDNFLGGKNFDWAIVDKIIVPKILEKYKLSNFTRNNSKYSSIFAKLKYLAESSKIDLSQNNRTTIEIEDLGEDDSGKEISVSFPFTRLEFEKLISPMIERTIELTKDTLKDAGFKNSSVKRIILVGGPTQIPLIKKELENELKIFVDTTVDPLTVVARGACIFGISEKIPKEFLNVESKSIKRGTHLLELNYTTLTSDTEESITGTIADLNEGETYYIQLQSDSGTFTGPKTKVNKGKFYYTVDVEPNKQNLFYIYVFDNKGNSLKLSPESFTITHGLSVSGAPTPHSIGVVVATRDFASNQTTNVCEKIIEKGEVLPLKKNLDVYKTSRKLNKGEENSLNIDVVEGESPIPDRNTYLCSLGINGKELPHNLPAGTPVELTIEMNDSREVSVTAYIPLIDLTLNARATFKDEVIDVENMSRDLEAQKERAKTILENSSIEERNKIDNLIQSVSTGISNANLDEDEKRKASKQLKDLKVMFDKLDEEKALPQLEKEFNLIVDAVMKVIEQYADPKRKNEFKEQLEVMNNEGKTAIRENNKALIIRVNEQLLTLRLKVLQTNPNVLAEWFKQIAREGNFTNDQQAQYYVTKGVRAIESGDIEELRRCTNELLALRPQEIQNKNNLSGITR